MIGIGSSQGHNGLNHGLSYYSEGLRHSDSRQEMWDNGLYLVSQVEMAALNGNDCSQYYPTSVAPFHKYPSSHLNDGTIEQPQQRPAMNNYTASAMATAFGHIQHPHNLVESNMMVPSYPVAAPSSPGFGYPRLGPMEVVT